MTLPCALTRGFFDIADTPEQNPIEAFPSIHVPVKTSILTATRHWQVVIRQQVGGPEVLREQLRRITRPPGSSISVQVVPFAADAHAALGDSFVIIQWPDEHDAGAVYVDGQTSTQRLGDQIYLLSDTDSMLTAPPAMPGFALLLETADGLVHERFGGGPGTGRCVRLVGDGVADDGSLVQAQ